MKIKAVSENQLNDQIYEGPRLPKSLWSLLVNIPFFIGLFLNYPIKTGVENAFKKRLALLPCSVKYSSLEMEFFLPKVILNDPIISGACFNSSSPGKDLVLSNLVVHFRGPSILPPGMKFLVSSEFQKSQIRLYYNLSFNKHMIRVEDTKINLQDLTGTLGLPPIAGNLEVTTLADLGLGGDLQGLDLLAKSRDLTVPPQMIKGLSIPTLPLGNFLVKAHSENGNVVMFKEVVVGNENSPIMANYNGPLTVNHDDFMFSQLNLLGEIKFSQNFVREFSIINLFLKNYRMKEGFYQMKITGELENLQFNPQ